MEERASIPPGLPRPRPTLSYWQDPPSAIACLRTTDHLPEHVDVVIIGSGITGASIAYNLLAQQPELSIVLLEAREAASGASGRNGGHSKGASYRSFLHNVNTLGEADAVRIARFEYRCMVQTHDFIKEHQIDCDARRLETVDIVYDQDRWSQAQESVALMRKLMGHDDVAAQYTFRDAGETAKRFLTPGAIGSISYEAGSLSTYQLVIGILRLALAKGLNLQCNTPATSISREEQGGWSVQTPRGVIRSGKLILATNAYTAHLYPKLLGVIVPLRGFVTAQRPGKTMAHTGLSNTYSFIYTGGYEYMIPQPKGAKFAGDIIIGGSLGKTADKGLSEYGNTDDTELNGEVIEYLKSSTEKYFGGNWGDDHPEGRIRKAWSGVMGYSGDGFPLVGPMPAEEGLYIAAAFQGHGMVNCFLCAKALAWILTAYLNLPTTAFSSRLGDSFPTEDEICGTSAPNSPPSNASSSNPPSPRPPPFSSLYFPSDAELDCIRASVTEAVCGSLLATAPAPSFEEALAEDEAESKAAAETKAALPPDTKGESSSKGVDDGEPPPPYTEGPSPLESFTYVMAAAGGAASIITQVQQTAGPPINTLGAGDVSGDDHLTLDLRGTRFTLSRDELLTLPEFVLLSLFPNGLLPDGHMNSFHEGDVYPVDIGDVTFSSQYDPASLQYMLDFYRAVAQSIPSSSPSPSTSPENDPISVDPMQGSARDMLQDRAGIIVLREDLDFYVIPPKQDIEQVEMIEVKRAAGKSLLRQDGIFSGLRKSDEAGTTEQHLIEMLTAGGFDHDDRWGHRAGEPNKAVICSLALARLRTDIKGDLASNNVVGMAQKLLLFWRKPARRCWWEGVELDDVEGVEGKLKVWIRRVWTLEMSVIGLR